jgi:hypothetical protein
LSHFSAWRAKIFFSRVLASGRNHEWCKVSALLKANLKVLLLLFPFVHCQDLVWILGEIGFGVYIFDANINYTTCPMSPEAVNQHVSLVFTLVLVKVADDQVCLVFKVVLLLCGATEVNFEFVAHCRWEEGLVGCQVTQFIFFLAVT